MIKKAIGIIMALAITFGAVAPISGNDIGFNEVLASGMCIEEFINGEFGEGFYQRHNDAIEYLNNFMQSLPKDRFGNTMYPEFYGGVRIDSDGNPVFYVVDTTLRGEEMSQRDMRMQEEFIQSLPYFATHYFVPRSYGELRNVADAFIQILDHRWEIGCQYAFNAIQSAIDWYLGYLVVELSIFNQEYIDGFLKNVIDSPLILLVEASEITIDRAKSVDADYSFRSHSGQYNNYNYYIFYSENEAYAEAIATLNAATVNPGDLLASRFVTLNPRGTMGFRASRISDGAIGIVSAGHSFQGINRVYPASPWNATHIGTAMAYNLNLRSHF